MPRIVIPHPRRPSFGGSLRHGVGRGLYADSGQAAFDVTMARLGSQRESEAARAKSQQEAQEAHQIAQERAAQRQQEAKAQAHVDQVNRNKVLWDQLVSADPNIKGHARAGFLEGVRDSGGNLAEAYKFVAHEDDIKNAAQKKEEAAAQKHADAVKAGNEYVAKILQSDPDLIKNPIAFGHIKGAADMGLSLNEIESAYKFEKIRAENALAKHIARDKFANATPQELAGALLKADQNGDAAGASAVREVMQKRGLDDKGLPTDPAKREAALWERYGSAKEAYDAIPEGANAWIKANPGKTSDDFKKVSQAATDKLNAATEAINQFRAQAQQPQQPSGGAPAQAGSAVPMSQPAPGAPAAPSQADVTVQPGPQAQAPAGPDPIRLKVGQETMASLQKQYPNFNPHADPAHKALWEAAMRENMAAVAQQAGQPQGQPAPAAEPAHDETPEEAPADEETE